jgi:hypothetical protein
VTLAIGAHARSGPLQPDELRVVIIGAGTAGRHRVAPRSATAGRHGLDPIAADADIGIPLIDDLLKMLWPFWSRRIVRAGRALLYHRCASHLASV